MTKRPAVLVGVAITFTTTLCSSAQAVPGTWERAWGKDVVSGNAETGFEICTVMTSCQAGSTVDGLGGELSDPLAVAVDSSGNVYAADSSNGRVQKFDSSGNFLRAWGKDVIAGNAETGFETCVAASADTCQAGDTGGLGGEFAFPDGIATDVADNVYVVDQGNNRIQKFDSSGTFLRAWGKDVTTTGGTDFEICVGGVDICKAGGTGGLGGELSAPFGAGTDPAGNVYVTDFGNQRAQKFDSSGNFLRAWGKDVVSTGGTDFEICVAGVHTCKAGSSGGLGGELNGPFGVAADASGGVYVSEANGQRLQKFDASGNFISARGGDVIAGGATGYEICTDPATCKAGSGGGTGGPVSGPRGLETDSAGDLYVADTANNRIQQFGPSGNFLRALGKDVIAGNAETGFEICTVATSCSSGDVGILGGEFDAPAGVATGSVADLHVGDSSNDRIQKFVEAAVQPPPVAATPPIAPTGQRARAIKKCKKKFPKGPRRKKCIKKAKRRPL